MPRETQRGRLSRRALFRLAWRNLFRNRKRTWITASTVAISVLLLEFAASLLIGVERQSFDNLINYQTGHAKLYPAGYFDMREDFPLDRTISAADSLGRIVGGVDGVAAATPRLVFSANLSDGVEQIACMGIGIDVQGSDSDVFRVPEAVVAGSYLEPDAEGMLLGSGLAKLFGAEVGDWMTVLAKTHAGAYEALDLPIVGLVGTGNPLIDQNTLMLPLHTARWMLDLPEQATEIALRFAPGTREADVLRRARARLATSTELDLRGWREVEQEFMALVQTKRTGQTVFLGIFVLLAIVGVTNTILMASFERTREIGTLMAIGLRGSAVRSMFLIEGGLTGLLGGAVGSVLAAVLVGWLSIKGWDLTATYGDVDIGYPVKDVVYPALEAATFLWVWIATGVLAALAALYPATRASRQDPVRSLRHV